MKTTKTAGTSIEIALSRHCEERDIVTPLVPSDEVTRRDVGGVGPVNHLAPVSTYRLGDLRRRLTGTKKVRYSNHMSGQEVRHLVGTETWDSSFTLCVERNPWDRVISMFHYFNAVQRPPRPAVDFDRFLRMPVMQRLKSKGEGIYCAGGEVIVDRVLRYESLASELEDVRVHLGLPAPLELPRAKGGHRTDRRPAREVYSDEQAQIVADLFADTIERMGYEL